MTPAGEMTERVRFEAPPDAEGDQDAHGQPAEDPVDLGTVWAKVEQLPGSEGFVADQYQAEALYQITIRRTDTGVPASLTTACFAYLGVRWGDLKARITAIGQPNRFDLVITASGKL